MEKLLALNTTKYNIGIQEMLFNKLRVKNFIATFSKKNAVIFDKVSAIINETNFFNIDSEQKFYFSGTDFNIFFDVKNEKKIPFVISGDINLKHYGKIFFENINSKIDTDILFLTNIEIQYNNAGIDFFIVDINFDKLDMKRINDFRENDDNLSTLKANMLFLNNFNINTIYNVKINNVFNGKWKDNNYALTLKIRNKKLAIYNLNFNNKIDGKLDINIEKDIPTLSMTLNFDNYDYKTNFNFLETIFNIPTMESFNGNLSMTIKNSRYHTSQLNDVDIKAEITDGSFSFKTFDFKDAFGGHCKLNDGFIDLKYNRRLSFALKECVVSLDQTFYLLAGIKKIHGDIGLALVLFSEGPDIENFKTNFLVKGNFIGNGIKVENFAIHTLSENLFKIKFNKKLLFDIKPLDILFDKGSVTVLESVTGNITYQKKTNTALLSITEKSSLHNGVISGSIDFFPNYLSLKLDSKMNIWAGDIENPIPLLLGIALEGDTGITYSYSANIQQINDYIDALRINNNQKLKNEKEKADNE
ncbi:MAG: hypothetical protein Ta2D_04240 [Rickettsiales bacterium]|nr:MAG: hypothetical protein Ta2D_04240 [Rickettsiales bacterium]